MTQVYRIDKTNTSGNSHGVNRDETWSVSKDNIFASYEDAMSYIIMMNKRLCGYELGILYSYDPEIIAYRCTDIEWCHKQRYFIGYPNLKLINEKLKHEGITTYAKVT